MPDDIDLLIHHLRASAPDEDLSGLEGVVTRRIRGAHSRGATGGDLKLQVAVVCGAMALGIAVAHFSRFAPMPGALLSETIVLSDDSGLAPSVRLEGGS